MNPREPAESRLHALHLRPWAAIVVSVTLFALLLAGAL